MRKHVLFLVHGMGDNVNDDGSVETGWAKNAEETLKEFYNDYQILKLVPFEERFEVVAINYDTIFNNLLKRWADQSAALRATGVPIDGIVKEVFDWLDNGAKQEDNFAWTHVVDVVLYRFFSLVRQRVKTHVAKQFMAALKPNNEGAVTSWSVIAHSLGCIITHDVLHAMDATSPNEAGISILDAMVPSANVVAMISNVSKVMENDIGVYDSQVVPPTTIKSNTACFHYLNANNKLDPFVLPMRFDPKGDPEWKQAKQSKSYLDIRIDNVHEKNVHSFKNYLVNPQVHIPLFEQMAGRGSIMANEKDQAKQQFKNIKSDQLLAKAKDLLKNTKSTSWFKVVGNLYGQLK
ncbi:MAG: hypothetical protein QNK19_11605 [Xanthomonadales bacterium]|nr:hypothetical protein [Xanthomonadales bacterium]